MAPSIFLIGLGDLQRKFLIQTGKSQLQMKVQIICTCCHVGYNFLFVSNFGLGVVGTALASFVTNLQVLIMNLFYTSREEELEAALQV